MPTYDYKCENCGHLFEYFQSMADDPLTKCPDCEQDALKRLIGGGMGVIFKGSGFYVNDAKKSSSTSKPLKDKTASSSADSGKKDTSKSAS
ncbi:MAG: zinc ribbon domain-containing protein [Spirochaetales bacterium]|nr:zinc ribbon domain-containing protein [Spirochaetales bacterium]